ncbi:sulfotransferase [Fragilaria crotonensis]|nr:sulfotransferase [Fragilaria crotonensis]
MSAGHKDDVLRPSYTDHDGFLLPKGFPVQGFTNGLRYEAQPNDVFVVTYPKCGTTWMQHLVYLILNDGKPLAADEKMDFVFPHLEEVGNEFCSRAPLFRGFRLIKTHLPFGMTPQNPKAKYIFVARNPKDCVVSFFHHTRGFVKHYDFSEGRFDVFFDLFLHGKVDFGDYFTTLRSWYDHKDDPNVLFLTYEDLRRDTRAGVLSLAEFLDPNTYPERLRQEGDIMDQILLHSSLESMKKDPSRFCSERPKEHPPFIRKGSVGEWDELLSDEQADLLDQMMRENFNDEERKLLGGLYA